MGNLRTFVLDCSTNDATTLVDGAGDSTTLHQFGAVSEAFGEMLYDCTPLKWKGYMVGDNIFSSAGAPDGFVDCLPRRNLNETNPVGTIDNAPAGCAGAPVLGGFGANTTLTTVGGITNVFTGAITVNQVDQDWWTDGNPGIIQFMDTGEIVRCSNKVGTTLTISTRALHNSTAAAHAQGAGIMNLTHSNAGDAPWLIHLHGLLGAAATFALSSAAGIQPRLESPMGTQGELEFIWCGENPTGSVVVGAQIRLSIYTVDNPGDAVSTIRNSLALGSTLNPTTTDAAGTLLATAVSCAAGARINNTAPLSSSPVWADVHGSVVTTGNYLGVRKIIHNKGRAGGILQTRTASKGGTTLRQLVSCMLRTPNFIASQVKKNQCARFVASTGRGGNGKYRKIWYTNFMHNDVGDTGLAFVVPGQAWTIDSTKTTTLTASYNASVTTFTVADTTNLPTQGHGYNPVTLERFTWTGKTATTLTGIARGDYGTTAAASSGSTDTLQFSFQHHTAVGFVSTLMMLHTLLRTIHDAADISQANASYPFATSGTFNMLSPETGVPNHATEHMHVLLGAMPVSMSSTATSGVVTTWAQRQKRHRDIIAAARAYMGGLVDFDVMDPAEVVTLADILSAGANAYPSSASIDTTLSAILNTGDTTASLAASIASSYTEGYMSIDGEWLYWNGISGAGPYTYSNLVRNLTGQSGALVSHASGAKVGFVDPIHHTRHGYKFAYTKMMQDVMSNATSIFELEGL